MANVKQTQKMIPFITCEIALGQYVCELVLGVNMFDLDLWLQVNYVEQPIKRNSVGSWHMPHVWTAAFDDNFDHRFIIHKIVELKHTLRELRVSGDLIHTWQLINISG